MIMNSNAVHAVAGCRVERRGDCGVAGDGVSRKAWMGVWGFDSGRGGGMRRDGGAERAHRRQVARGGCGGVRGFLSVVGRVSCGPHRVQLHRSRNEKW
jgi:hypothetical protein